MNTQKIYIIFGVSGSGKTTIGNALAKALQIPFYDADDFHPQSNIKKMAAGSPLNDQDRSPWLHLLADRIKGWHQDQGAVLACSALKEKYRKILESIASEYIQWIFLEGSYEVIVQRMEARENHFFKKEMLSSQFEALEKSTKGISVSIDQSSTKIVNQILSILNTKTSQLGLIGLGVMGKSLARNFLSKNISLSVYNRQVPNKEVDIAKQFVAQQSADDDVQGFDDLQAFVESLQQPRTVMIMVNAGKPIDLVIDSLIPVLQKGDTIIDGGNSHYKKTAEREEKLSKHGIYFLGTGISGGEEGALKGPSIMPGGSKEAYAIAGKFLEIIAAKDKNDTPCCTYMGSQGAGHYIKMVHNGIEYAEMQLLAETYHLLRFYAKKTPIQISDIFESWRKRGKDSYLLEITAAILRYKEGEEYLIDNILDKAGQKGTGGWSTVAALEIGMPLPTISESVMARNLSGMKSQRITASAIYTSETATISKEESVFVTTLEKAFHAASIINHAIGFDLLSEASKVYGWNLNVSEIARIWTNGCIIRSELMEEISMWFQGTDHGSLLLFPEIVQVMKANKAALTTIVATAVDAGYPLPVLSAAANYFLTYTSAQSSANMIQAQRDYFGAHTYQRVDQPITEYFHTNWKK